MSSHCSVPLIQKFWFRHWLSRLTLLQAQIGYYSTQARTKPLAFQTPSPQAFYLDDGESVVSIFLPNLADGNAGPPTSGPLRCAPLWKRPHTSRSCPIC